MKSVMQAMWALIVACGNAIVIIVVQVRGIERKATEFFVFAGIMGGATIVFALLASRYTYGNNDAVNGGWTSNKKIVSFRKPSSGTDNNGNAVFSSVRKTPKLGYSNANSVC